MEFLFRAIELAKKFQIADNGPPGRRPCDGMNRSGKPNAN